MNNPYGSPPRDISIFVPTKHLRQKMRERNIGGHELKMALREGEVEGGGKETDVRYKLTMPGPDLIVSVDTRNNKIETAFYVDEQGAIEGGI